MTDRPLVCTFAELADMLVSLHHWDKSALSDLHDIYKVGAPAPNAIVRNPHGFDERKRQPGNYVPRIIFPSLLGAWVAQQAARRGLSPSQLKTTLVNIQRLSKRS